MAGPYTCSSGEDPELRIQQALPPLLPGLHHLKPTKRLAVRCLKDTHYCVKVWEEWCTHCSKLQPTINSDRSYTPSRKKEKKNIRNTKAIGVLVPTYYFGVAL